MHRFRQRLYDIFHDDAVLDPLERSVNAWMLALILLNVLAVILETVEPLYQQLSGWFDAFEIISVIVFSVEYLLRLWSAGLNPKYRQPVRGTLRFLFSPLALIDLLAILPFFLQLGFDFRFIRAIRLFRVVRLLKVGHYSAALKALSRVIQAKKEELLLTVFSGAILLVLASTVMYYIEKDAQPDVFTSIPSAMWWGVATLTTIGYGDIYPTTGLGRLVGSFIAVLGIGLFALPAGIIASGFAGELQSKPKTMITCPHCGEVIHIEGNG